MSVCLITWDGPCPNHGQWHACKSSDEYHRGKHKCACGAVTAQFLNPARPREPAPRIYQRIPPRVRPSYVKRDETYYWPKYLKRKRGLL